MAVAGNCPIPGAGELLLVAIFIAADTATEGARGAAGAPFLLAAARELVRLRHEAGRAAGCGLASYRRAIVAGSVDKSRLAGRKDVQRVDKGLLAVEVRGGQALGRGTSSHGRSREEFRDKKIRFSSSEP
jgi:hypothetical protein